MGARGRVTCVALFVLAGCVSSGGWSLATDDNDVERLGEACPSREEKDAYRVDVCGTKERVSLEVDDQHGQWRELRPSPVHRRLVPGEPVPAAGGQPAMPCEPVLLSDVGPYHGPDSTWACVANGHLVASFECRACRVAWRTTVHARISELTREQATAIYLQLGLSGDAPTNEAGWQAALDEARSPALRDAHQLALPVNRPP